MAILALAALAALAGPAIASFRRSRQHAPRQVGSGPNFPPQLQVFNCSAAYANNQYWQILPDHTIRLSSNGFCMGVQDYSTADGVSGGGSAPYLRCSSKV